MSETDRHVLVLLKKELKFAPARQDLQSIEEKVSAQQREYSCANSQGDQKELAWKKRGRDTNWRSREGGCASSSSTRKHRRRSTTRWRNCADRAAFAGVHGQPQLPLTG